MNRILRWALCALVLLGSPVIGAEAPEIAALRDLREEAAAVRAERMPLLVMFYADHCVYCMRMEEEFLKPMLISGDYDHKVRIRRVRLDENFVMRDLDGGRLTGAEFAQRYNAFVTPTLLFLDARGNELAPKMVGLGTPDFFGGYLDAAIDDSLVRLRGPGAGSTDVAGRIDENCNPMC